MKKIISLITAMVFLGVSEGSFAHAPIGACYIRVKERQLELYRAVERDVCYEVSAIDCYHMSKQLKGEVKKWKQGAPCSKSEPFIPMF